MQLEQIVLDSVTKSPTGHCLRLPKRIRHYPDRYPRYRRYENFKDVKWANPLLLVVMMTGYASDKSAVQAINSGYQIIRKKSFTPEKFINIVNKGLKQATIQKSENKKMIYQQEMIKALE